MESRYNLKRNCCVVPKMIHIEVTERCPLSCKQCYCDLIKGQDLDWDICEKTIKEASAIGVQSILITGGEPLIYPHLTKMLRLISEQGLYSAIATSGFGLTLEKIKKLNEAGLDQIYISLNGSKKEIHELSRDKFDESIEAIKLLKASGNWCAINWVARKDNVYDFPDLLKLAKELKVDEIDILSCKKSCIGENPFLNEEELNWLVDVAKKDYDDNYIYIDLCYPELRMKINKEELHPVLQKCVAGRIAMDVLVDGKYSPCRHILKAEKYESMLEYWNNSDVLQDIRSHISEYEQRCRR